MFLFIYLSFFDWIFSLVSSRCRFSINYRMIVELRRRYRLNRFWEMIILLFFVFPFTSINIILFWESPKILYRRKIQGVVTSSVSRLNKNTIYVFVVNVVSSESFSFVLSRVNNLIRKKWPVSRLGWSGAFLLGASINCTVEVTRSKIGGLRLYFFAYLLFFDF